MKLALIAVVACAPPHSRSADGGVEPDGATACVAPLSLPALPPLGERRCMGLPAGAITDPSAPGPYPVGVKTIQIADPLRPGRTLTTEVWYPADASARGGPGTGYSVTFAQIAAMLGVAIPVPGSVEIVHTDAVRDAPRAPIDAATGLVVFSHGFRGTRFQSTFYTVAIASHGYVVAAPDHVGNTMFDGSATPEQSAKDRVEDMALVTTEMLARTRSASDFFAASFDPRRIAWSGHSFGASTDIMASVFDNREALILPLAPCFEPRMTFVYNPPSYDGRNAAVFIGGSADTRCPATEQQLAYDRTVAPRYLAILDGAQHMDFTDVCANALLRAIPQIGSSCGAHPEATQAAARTLAIAALDRYVRCNEHSAIAAASGVALTADPGAAVPPAETPQPRCELAGDDAAPATELTVQHGGPPIHVVVRGAADATPLVLVHGLSTTGAVFEHQLAELSRRYRVIALDLRGHGGSGLDPAAPLGPDGMPGTADDPYTVAHFADDVDAVLAELHLDRPIVIGWSSGGEVALEMARRGAALRGLVLVDATPLTVPDEVAHPMFNGGGTLHFARALRLAVANANQSAATWRPVVEQFVTRTAPSALVDMLLAIAATVSNATRIGQLANRPDLVDVLASIAVPTLVIHGEQDDAVLLESGRFLAAHIPGAKLEVFQRSGHAPFAEEPERFDAVIDRFAQSL